MANTKSTIKRIRQNEKRRIRNSRVKSSVRTSAKKVISAIEKDTEDPNIAGEYYKEFVKNIDTASRKGIIHWKTAARKKSRLAKKINQLSENKTVQT